jgi:hypothetical protein
MSAAYAYPDLTDAERARVLAYIHKGDTKAAPRRGALGLAPAPGDDGPDDERDVDPPPFEGFHFKDGPYKDCPETPLRSDWSFYYFDIIGEIFLELHNDNVKTINGLIKDANRFDRENKNLKSELATLEAKFNDMALQLAAERQRAASTVRPKPRAKAA